MRRQIDVKVARVSSLPLSTLASTMPAPLCDCKPARDAERRTSQSAANPGRDYWACPSRSCDFFKWCDARGTSLTAAGPRCRCGMPTVKKISGSAANPNRPFWSCASTAASRCKFFKWAGEAKGVVTPESASKRRKNCCKKCSAAVTHRVVRKEGANKGRTFYKCDACGKFEFVTDPPPPPEHLEGSVEYLVDEETRRILQDLFHVPPGVELGVGRDYDAGATPPYDYLKVECAWRVKNPTKAERFRKFATARPDGPTPDAESPIKNDAFARAGGRVKDRIAALAPGDDRAGAAHEHVLIHGTNPEALYPILFQGLDPKMAREGIFGSGTYLAEDGAKIDQYLKKDAEWQGRKEDHPLHKLHRKLYENNVKHAGDVYYALVCSVQFDAAPARTTDGETHMTDGSRLWDDGGKDKLAADGHTLIAETGGAVKRFREFVVFEPAAIRAEYLVALKRTLRYCKVCSQPAVEKSVVAATENQGRPILVCAACNWTCMLPQCYCGRSAGVALTKRGSKYYRCGKRHYQGKFCNFRDWNGPT